MDFKGKTIFLTGSTGFVGAATARYFVEQGAYVIGLYKEINKKSTVFLPAKNYARVVGDILDIDTIRSHISKYEVDYVIHLASQPIVRICHNDPYTAYRTNILGTLNVLEAIRTLKNAPKKVIVMTSDKYYGPAPVPYVEDTPPVVGDTYSTSKTCQDLISQSYASTYNLPIVVVRASNIYGPGDLNTSRLIPRSILNLLDNKNPMLYDGVAGYVREFVYVDDVATAFHTLLLYGRDGEAYNVGGTEHFKIKDVIQMIVDKVNPKAAIDIQKKDFYEIPEQYLNADKLKNIGWAPKTNMDTGLDKTIQYYKDHLEIYQ
jgi:CDP-glucose 4,6-dehydratase